MTDTTKGFTLTRNLDASPEQIWNAWTDADEVAEWWHPRGAVTPRGSVDLDVRVGGRYRYTMVDQESGNEVVTGGEYTIIEPHTKLAFSWGDRDAAVDDSPLVTLEITDVGDLTRLTFDIRGVDGMPGDGYFHDGWESALDSLVAHLGQSAVHG
jgi:uncharacterized protein YndB with AHSA1/START domain